MAITNEDGVIAGLKPAISYMKTSFTAEAAGVWHNLMAVAGNPGAVTMGTPGLGGVAVTYATTIGGMINWTNPSSGEARIGKMSPFVGANLVGIRVFDLLWYNSGLAVTTTTAQTVNSVTFSARDRAGTTNGDGVQIWLWNTVATTNAAAVTNTTFAYTNSAGTGSRSAGLIPNWPATAAAGTCVPFGLQGSDIGVRSIQTITLGTSYGAGTLYALALRPIATVFMSAPLSGMVLDWAQLGCPVLFNDSALFCMVMPSSTAAGTVENEINFTHG